MLAAPARPVAIGHIHNEVQQRLAERDVLGASALLAGAVRAAPADGFTHRLLAQVQVQGLRLVPEAEAIYAAALQAEPDDGARVAAWTAARIERHRADRFLGPQSAWVVDTERRLLEAVDRGEATGRYEAFVALRDLRALVGDKRGARDAAVAAHALVPAGLQGRISALLLAVAEGDLDDANTRCVDILRSDPWAAEACASLWKRVSDAPPPGLVEALAGAEEGADAVTLRELWKLYERAGDRPRAAAIRGRLDALPGGFTPPQERDWWKQRRIVDVPYRALNVGTSKALQATTHAERLAALLAWRQSVPQPPPPDWGVRRYLGALADAARGVGDRETLRWALAAGAASDPEDARLSLELAQACQADGDVPAALEAVRAAGQRVLDRRWVPLDATEPDFGRFVLGQEALLLEAATLERELAGDGARLPAGRWPTDAAGWLDRARREDDDLLAAYYAIEGLSRLTPLELERVPRRATLRAAKRLVAVFPQIACFGLDPDEALRAAAAGRRVDRAESERGDGRTHPLVGSPAPSLSVTTLSGARLDDRALQGRVVVIDFWATWCGPCKQAMPELDAARRRLADAPVTFLALSVDDDAAVLPPFLDATGYGFDVAHIGPRGTKQQWQVRGIPSTFIVGPDGVIRYHHQGFRAGIGASIETEIRALLAGAPER